MQIVHGAILKQSSQTKYQLLEVAFMRSRLLCIHMLALNNQELEKNLSNTNSYDSSKIHSWNDNGRDFDYQFR